MTTQTNLFNPDQKTPPHIERRHALAERLELHPYTVKECEMIFNTWNETAAALEIWKDKYQNLNPVNFCMNIEFLK